MAARSVLVDVELGQALLAAGHFPGEVGAARQALSARIETELLQRLRNLGEFTALKPVLLGSWARGELCPKSDVDVLFTGDEARVAEFVGSALGEGLKLRARTPADIDDWTIGVEPFDVLALHGARALDADTARALDAQRVKLKPHRASIFRAIKKERDERRRRQDSVTNYLEPNLKFGAGGLRDIEQALALQPLFPKQFLDADPYPFEVLRGIKEQFLFLRAQLHVMGSGDTLTATDQLELAERLNVANPKALMTLVQRELERASFYADWVVAKAGARISPKPNSIPKTLAGALKTLSRDPSLLRQFEVRRRARAWFENLAQKDAGRLLARALKPKTEDAVLVALHRTRLLEGFLPDLERLRGLVQHDHYHRYTADAHIVQTLREVQRAEVRPHALGPLGALSRDLKAGDWWTLKLTALFHDLAKGLDGSHAVHGARLANAQLTAWAFTDALRDEVVWLVENHLLLSTAAFRQNPRAPATWQRLFERGAVGHRLKLLTVFTAIDIRATNPDAWTTWKADLLVSLFRNVTSPNARHLRAHLELAKGKREVEARLLNLDPDVLSNVVPRVLFDDLERAGENELTPLVVRGRDRRLWVRFHQPADQPGVFLDFVRRLFGFGLNIQLAAVHTIEGVGAYDWFCLKTEKSAAQIGAWLALETGAAPPLPRVVFQSIDLMSKDAREWVFSFRGRDQRGLLVNAASALGAQGLSIRWARAHTWGGQVDDVFSVAPEGDVEAVLARLRKGLKGPTEV